MINILLYNLNSSVSNKILTKIILSYSSDSISIYSNNQITFKNIEATIINVNNNLSDVVESYKIDILITGVLTFKIDNIISNNCKIVSVIKNTKNIDNIHTITDINSIINDLLTNNTAKLANVEKTHTIKAPAISSPTLSNKEKFRNICNKYSTKFREIPLPSVQLNKPYEAVFIEFRELPHIEILLRNSILNLGSEWSYTVVCGNSNYSFFQNICRIINSNIKIIKLEHSNIDQNTYNNMLLSTDFWNLFTGEKILIYQEDTLIFKNNISSFLEYDYVGAPFGPSCVTPINVGNGGLSLRTKSVMISVLNIVNPYSFSSRSAFTNSYKNTSKLDKYPEDVYFSQVIQDKNIGKVCPYQTSLTFSSEHIFTNEAFGMHCIWFCNSKWEEYIHSYFESKLNEHNMSIQDDTINAYILHCYAFSDRTSIVNNLKNQLEDMNVNTSVFESVNTTTCDLKKERQLDVLKQYDPNLHFYNDGFIFYKPGQIGCYLGHHLVIKHIMETGKKGYSLIFEDDALIDNNFINKVNNIISFLNNSNKEFDIIYLGFLNNNNGNHIGSTVYSINKDNWLFGAQGLLINNKSISKLYTNNCSIRHEIDNNYKLLMNEDIITGYYINPGIVKQNRKIKSYIGFHN